MKLFCVYGRLTGNGILSEDGTLYLTIHKVMNSDIWKFYQLIELEEGKYWVARSVKV